MTVLLSSYLALRTHAVECGDWWSTNRSVKPARWNDYREAVVVVRRDDRKLLSPERSPPYVD
jgi:hypothetical protein